MPAFKLILLFIKVFVKPRDKDTFSHYSVEAYLYLLVKAIIVMLDVDFHSPDFYPECGITYVIIGARYMNKWVFIKHKRRKSYELPAGHIDEEEDTDTAAQRELQEETGAKKYKIVCISTYTVRENNKLRAGRLYYADIEIMGGARDEKEIDDIILSDSLPARLGFHHVQRVLFNYLQKYLSGRINSAREDTL